MRIEQVLIKDSPSFKSLELSFHRGLNIISGASGAGKSVFFASLLALFGLKDCNASVLEGFLEGDVELFEYLSEDELNIQILKKEKTRYFINHQSTSKRRLGEIFSPYVKFLSHKNSNELESTFLLSLLDGAVEKQEHLDHLVQYRKNFAEYQELTLKLKQLQDDEKRIIELKEFARFEIEKITSLNPRVGEYEELLECKKMLSKKEKLQKLGNEALGALEQMGRVGAFLEALECEVEGFSEMMLELDSRISSEMQRLEELQEQDPEEVLERLSKLSTLISRYGGVEEALEYAKEQQSKLEGYEKLEDNQKEIKQKISRLQDELQNLSQSISKERKQSLPKLIKQINHYATLLLLNGVNLVLNEVGLGRDGSDELVISLGDSSPLTLSSGEYNRLRLATLAVQNQDNAGILLLDEIDANLSGEESEGVAKVLKKLASSYQIFAISHQPHLPAFADAHFLVQRGSEGSTMRELDKEGRVQEIARMISGSELSNEALEFARKRVEGK